VFDFALFHHAAKTMNHFTGTLVFRDYVPDRVRAAKRAARSRSDRMDMSGAI
jgi:hypothetical protein